VLLKVRVDVLVDDYLSERGVAAGALPAHGLGLYVEAQTDDGRSVSVLVDGGPLLEVLAHNCEALGVSLSGVGAAVAGMWSAHHVAALLKLARVGGVRRVYLPPPPRERARPGWEEVSDLGLVLLQLEAPLYKERLVLLDASDGYVAIAPCSAYGVDLALRALGEFEEARGKRVKALVGGFNVSTFSLYDLRLLLKYAKARGATLVPLHSTSLEAREWICERTGLEEVPGVGLRLEL